MTAAPPIQFRNAQGLRVAAFGLIGAAAVWPLVPHPETACPLRATTGIPCPMCGMTRACAAAVHGHLATSLAFNPAGMLLIATAIIAIVRPQVLTRIRVPVWVTVFAFGTLWLWNIGFNPTFHQLLWR